MRDDFPIPVKDVLAKRVGYRCSNPDCRQLTSGPQFDPSKAVNIGVAAHITAASPDGPRYDPALTSEQRSAAENGIWLCQNHGKLVDNDRVRYSVTLLREWKRIAETTADLELQNPRHASHEEATAFAKAERLMPDLLRAMRDDLAERPLTREFVILKKGSVYNSRGPFTAYYYEDHPDLDDKLQILKNVDLIQEITYNNTRRFIMTETFAEYLGRNDSPFPFLREIGVYFDPTNRLHVCPRCLSDGKRSFLKDGSRGFSCTVCGQYFVDPKRTPPPEPPRDLGPLGWMAN
ncbi:MAG: hypothetical protein HY048_04360 [Acidobacteria bacterium]|nr:hypothetical protein [Acidobacteriota bacterium]